MTGVDGVRGVLREEGVLVWGGLEEVGDAVEGEVEGL